jgi:hypothetical protein
MTYEDKAKESMAKLKLDQEDSARLLGMAYIADSISKGFRRLSKVIDNISLEVQDEADQ